MNPVRFALAVLLMVPAALSLGILDESKPQDAAPIVEAPVVDGDVLRERNAQLEAENAQLKAELDKLRAELAWVSEQRYVERLNHQRWVEAVATLKPDSVKLVLPVGLTGTAPEEEAEEAAPDPSLVRAGEMVISLRNLFKSEGLYAYDLLEGGRFADGKLGPVVFRLLDDRGRLAGSLAADSMTFEAGRTGRSVTLVLSRGEERRAGLATPFSERRLPLTGVDPRPWIARVPELFPAADLGVELDDGKWDHAALRGRMNELMALDVAAGYLRFENLEGVSGKLMFGVDFAELDADGRVRRHLFADTMEIGTLDRGIVLQLFGCLAIKGGTKTPFPGGVHRVFLPRADQAAWRAAKLPGLTLSETPASE